MKVFIWGTGLIAQHLTLFLRDEINLLGYIESEPTIEKLGGVPVYSPEILLEKDFDKVYLASSFQDEILKRLQSLQVSPMKICAYWNETDGDMNFDLRLAMMRKIAQDQRKRGIFGSVAELGVYKGAFSQYISRAFPDSKYYLFDTFDGFDARDVNRDVEKLDFQNKPESHDFFFSDEEYVCSRLSHRENAIVKKGYFPDTAADVEDEFIFVLIDVDLHDPILAGLEYFYPRMKKGGCIFVHDYSSPKWPGAYEAVTEFSSKYDVSYIPLVDMGGSVVFVK